MQGNRTLSFKKLRPLSNFDIKDAAREIPHLRGVFMRDELPSRIENMECGVVNLDAGSGGGTHWVAYWKDDPAAIYFDSYGLDPPKEVLDYLSRSASAIRTQTFQLQEADDVICGHLCLRVLWELTAGRQFEDIVLSLI